MQAGEFGFHDGMETRIVKCRPLGHVADRKKERLMRRDVPDAAAKFVVFSEGYKRATVPVEVLKAAGGTFVRPKRADGGLDRVASDIQELILLGPGEGECSLRGLR